MAGLTDKETGELVRTFEFILHEKFVPSHIFTMNATANLNMRNHYNEIRSLEQRKSSVKAVEKFLRYLHDECNEPGRYISFVRALEEYGYTWAPLFRGEVAPFDGDDVLENHLEQFRGHLHEVKPTDILLTLKTEGCLTSDQCEEITKEENNTSCSSAIFKLLDFLPRCKKSDRWVTYLMVALAKNKYEHIVESIIPALRGHSNFASIAPEVDSFKRQNSTGYLQSSVDQEMVCSPQIGYQEEGEGDLPIHGNPNAIGFSSLPGHSSVQGLPSVQRNPPSLGLTSQSRTPSATRYSGGTAGNFSVAENPSTAGKSSLLENHYVPRTLSSPGNSSATTNTPGNLPGSRFPSLPSQSAGRAPGSEYQPTTKQIQRAHVSPDPPGYQTQSQAGSMPRDTSTLARTAVTDDDASSVFSTSLTVNDHSVVGAERPRGTSVASGQPSHPSYHESATLQLDERRGVNEPPGQAAGPRDAVPQAMGAQASLQDGADEPDSFFTYCEEDDETDDEESIKKKKVPTATLR